MCAHARKATAIAGSPTAAPRPSTASAHMLVALLEKLRVMERSGAPRYSHFEEARRAGGAACGWVWSAKQYRCSHHGHAQQCTCCTCCTPPIPPTLLPQPSCLHPHYCTCKPGCLHPPRTPATRAGGRRRATSPSPGPGKPGRTCRSRKNTAYCLSGRRWRQRSACQQHRH